MKGNAYLHRIFKTALPLLLNSKSALTLEDCRAILLKGDEDAGKCIQGD